MESKIGENSIINLFSTDLDDLRKETRDYSVHQLLNKLDEVEDKMTHYALLKIKSQYETEKEELEKEFNLLYNQTFYILQLIGKKMHGK